MLDLKIKKINLEILVVVFIFLISCINSSGLYISMILSLLYLLHGKMGLVKLMFLYILRTNISPGLFYDISYIDLFQLGKWIVIFGGSLFLLINLKKPNKSILIIYLAIYTVYLVSSSLITTNNITLAIFKIVNYILPLFAFLLNIHVLKNKILIDWVFKVLQLAVLVSLPLYFTSLGFLRNGHGFQGIYNNPNMFGIILVLSYAMLITVKKSNKLIIPLTIIYLLLVIETESRTSLISLLILIVFYSLTVKVNKFFKLLIVTCLAISLVLVVTNFQKVIYEEILVKGDNKDVLGSRRGQIENFQYAIQRHPALGNGFGVPIQKNSVILNDSTIVEAGNLFMAISMYSGILGLVMILGLILLWLKCLDKKFTLLFLSTLLINMGEMVLFSSNSIGLWCSMFWIICLDNNFLEVRR